MEDNLQEQLDGIGKMLDTSLEYGLELEVIYFSLQKMKENPNLLPVEAFALGVTEFVK